MKPDLRCKGKGDRSLITWLLLGSYFVIYIFVYIRELFFAGADEMRVFRDIPPAWFKLGSDLLGNIYRCQQLLSTGQPDNIGFYFSPIWILLFKMLGYVNPLFLRWSWTLTTIVCFVLGCVLLPTKFAAGARPSPAVVIITLLGLTSYGLRFEIERGQWNVIVLFMSLCALLLVKSKSTVRRVFGYCLFSFAVHLKLWPVFLGVGFFRAPDGWGVNVKRLAYMVIGNVVLLFCLGPSFLSYYIGNVIMKVGNPNVWIGDHSVVAFARLAVVKYGWSMSVGAWLGVGFSVFFVLVVMYGLYRGIPGNDVLIIALCVLAGLLLPSTSNDYKLALLPIVLALLVECYILGRVRSVWQKYLELVAMGVITFCYSFTLFGQVYRPGWSLVFQSNTLYICAIAISVMLLIVIQGRKTMPERV